MNKEVKVLSSQKVYQGKWLTVRVDEIIKPDGTQATHEVLERNNGVLIIPKVNEKFLMVKMYRYPVNDYSLEFPMGFMEKEERPSDSAIRELREETGLLSHSIKELGLIWAWSGLMNQKIHIFYADKFTKEKQNLEKTEKDLTLHFLSYDEIFSAVKKSVIKNSATLSALAIYSSTEFKP